MSGEWEHVSRGRGSVSEEVREREKPRRACGCEVRPARCSDCRVFFLFLLACACVFLWKLCLAMDARTAEWAGPCPGLPAPWTGLPGPGGSLLLRMRPHAQWMQRYLWIMLPLGFQVRLQWMPIIEGIKTKLFLAGGWRCEPAPEDLYNCNTIRIISGINRAAWMSMNPRMMEPEWMSLIRDWLL